MDFTDNMDDDNMEYVPLLPLHKNELHTALENGRYIEAQELIRSETEDFLVECFENYEGYSPPSYKSSLHLIAAIKDEEQAARLCRELLSKVKDVENREHLLNATVVEQFRIVRPRVAAIHIAAYNGNAGVVRLLRQEYGVDVNCNTSETIREEPQKGITPIHWASVHGRTEVVKLLLDMKADVNVRDTDGFTPLYIAAQNGHTEVVKLLLDHKADVNASRHTDGATPLYIAAWNGHTEVVKLLLDHKADLNASRHTDGSTPLYIAATNGHTEVVKLLINKDADADTKRQVCEAARQNRNLDIIKFVASL